MTITYALVLRGKIEKKFNRYPQAGTSTIANCLVFKTGSLRKKTLSDHKKIASSGSFNFATC